MRRRRTGSLHNVKPLRVVVLGKDGVGKSALTVRFLTRRFIGEYDQTESTYHHMVQVDSEDVSVDILDTAGENTGDKLRRWTRRGDLFLVLYSIVDRSSFDEARWIARYVKDNRNVDSMSMVLVATKKDLDHLRRVDIEEGIGFSNEMECTFYEVSISEGYTEVQELLQELLKRIISQRGEKKDSLKIPTLGIKRNPSFERKKRPAHFEKTPQLERKVFSSSLDVTTSAMKRSQEQKNHEDQMNNNMTPSRSLRDLSGIGGNDESVQQRSRFNLKSSSPSSQRKKNPFSVEKIKGSSSVNKLNIPAIESREGPTDNKPKAPFGLQKIKSSRELSVKTLSPMSKIKSNSNNAIIDDDKVSALPSNDKPKGPFLLDRLKSSSTDKLRASVSNDRLTATSSFGRFREGFGKTFGRRKAIYL